MIDRITYWRCRDCFGTGRKIVCGQAIDCYRCDASGNELGADRRRHQRQLDEIDGRNLADAFARARSGQNDCT